MRNQAPWVPDNGDGTYTNPVIFADYSDPDVVRVGQDCFMTASSFNCIPGLPILHSHDLVNWTLIGHALNKQPPFAVYRRPQHGNGVWAPAIRFHEGEFYIFYPDPDFGIYLVKATDAAGPWSEPLLVKSAKGWIDPCPFWDDDGNAYLVHAWVDSHCGIHSILTINRMSPDGSKVLDGGRTVFDGTVSHPIIEGPKIHKHNGYYYIFAPAGGVSTGWQTVLRSRHIYGPYEDKIVMARGNSDVNGPHQGAWVQLAANEDWFIHFQDRGPYGRVVHLQPLVWRDDWPVIGKDIEGAGKGEPVGHYRKPDASREYPLATPQTSDDFADPKLGLEWQWHANPEKQWLSLVHRSPGLRLFSVAQHETTVNLWGVPNLLLQKFPGPEFCATTKMEFQGLHAGNKAGLLVMGVDYSYLAVERTAADYRLVKISCMDAPGGSNEVLQDQRYLSNNCLYLRVTIETAALCNFSYSEDGNTFVGLGEPFSARAGFWIGAKVGLFSIANRPNDGYADFVWFRIEG